MVNQSSQPSVVWYYEPLALVTVLAQQTGSLPLVRRAKNLSTNRCPTKRTISTCRLTHTPSPGMLLGSTGDRHGLQMKTTWTAGWSASSTLAPISSFHRMVTMVPPGRPPYNAAHPRGGVKVESTVVNGAWWYAMSWIELLVRCQCHDCKYNGGIYWIG